MESRLQALGFDFTYDKELYDHLVTHNPERVQQHLLGQSAEVLSHNAHFLENHDEPRIATLLALSEHRMAAVLLLSLPGMRFLHEGQLEGWVTRTPVQLVRRAADSRQTQIADFYRHILSLLTASAIGQGIWRFLAVMPLPNSKNPTPLRVVANHWQSDALEFYLAVINMAPEPAHCLIPLAGDEMRSSKWKIFDLSSARPFEHEDLALADECLNLALSAHQFLLLRFKRL